MMLEVTRLRKEYEKGVLALADVDLTIGEGMFGLLGPNGAGKTTLMRILATILSPTSGTARVYGKDVRKDAREVRSMLGYLPQDFEGYGNLSVSEYLDYIGILKGLTADVRKRRVAEGMEQVNLTSARKTRVKHLSGGMKRRMGIAQALLNNPRILIVDEPTAGLDPEERVRFRNLLSRLSKGRVVILSTHIVEDVAGTCSQMAVMKAGKILRVCSPSQLIAEADGKVWDFTVDTKDFESIQQGLTVVNASAAQGGIRIRAIAENRPLPHAAPARATLEDAYLAVMKEDVR